MFDLFGSSAPPVAADSVGFEAMKGPIKVMLAYLVLYYCILYLQAFSAWYLFFWEKKNNPSAKASITKIKYSSTSTSRLKLTVDRSTGNLLEQSFPFLICFWLDAIYGDATHATRYGWMWLASRAIYPFAFYHGLPWILISSLPGYFFIFMMIYPVAMKVL